MGPQYQGTEGEQTPVSAQSAESGDDTQVVPEPLSAMTNLELAGARDDIGRRIKVDLLTPERRRELEQRLREIKAEIDRRGEAAELRTRYSS